MGRAPPDRPLPVARELGLTSLAFLVDFTFDAATMETVAGIVRDTLREASGTARRPGARLTAAGSSQATAATALVHP